MPNRKCYVLGIRGEGLSHEHAQSINRVGYEPEIYTVTVARQFQNGIPIWTLFAGFPDVFLATEWSSKLCHKSQTNIETDSIPLLPFPFMPPSLKETIFILR